jgi:anti-anti-sigma factor
VSTYQYISARQTGGVLILTVELTRIGAYEVAEAMGRELLEAVRNELATKVVVDLGKLEYSTSVGYGPLISLRGRVRDAGGRLVLCALTPVVFQMFDATRLLINPRSPRSLFEFTDTVENAVAMLSQ